jgi:tetratricopeptide (TPR) repeat protein
MGMVVLASRDDDQFRRRVAIKLIKRGMDSEQVLKRFELERQVLGGLNHPNIARLLDGGVADDGRPYFVMEYIEGQSLLDYCDAQQLSIPERLALFTKVCAAVQSAHQSLVVHRDLKPGNIVVGADGEPKLLDFGIAKLLNPDMAGVTVFTAEHQRLMTPEYASPEQVRGEPVTTLSDVYSLGVLLYELLAGVRPYNFKSRIEDEVKRVICEEEPRRPSAAATTEVPIPPPTAGGGTGEAPSTGQTAAATRARLRSSRPDALKRELSDDLDDIVLMAMRKSPRRRYASAEQLAEDIARHLRGDPVIARPETFSYVAAKFVARNRAGVAAAAVALAGLVLWGVSATVQWRATERARAAAETARVAADQAKEAESLARGEAEAARDQTRQVVAAFLTRALPEIRRVAGAVKARELISGISAEYLGLLESQAPGDAATMANLAHAYEELSQVIGGLQGANTGQRADAFTAASRAIPLRTQLVQIAPTGRAWANLGWARQFAGEALLLMGKPVEAEAFFAAAAEAGRAGMAFDDEGVLTAREVLALALHKQGERLLRSGKVDDAAQRMREALELLDTNARAKPDNNAVRRNLGAALTKLAQCATAKGQHEDAESLLVRALALRESIVAGSPGNTSFLRDVPITRERLANARADLGRLGDAEVGLRKALEELEPLLIADALDVRPKWDLVRITTSLGRCALKQGKHADARALAETALARVADLPPDAQQREARAEVLELLGRALRAAGSADARGRLIEAKAAWESIGADEPDAVEPRARVAAIGALLSQ